ncbi:hypothetical protein [Nitrincola alkalilacustris]|uniref:hypothetical protein n=1 Tax=Nitrincola alkalilacustris TaxID=1571224 RepID=UPI00124D9CEF|nr:hypothetical protein [Nitrincola alkalilacustris]
MPNQPEKIQCELCEREAHLTFHHLIPRKVHRRAHFKKHYTFEQLQRGLWLCYPCHRAIHKFHDEMTLARLLNTRERLLADDSVARHVDWVRGQRVIRG